MRQLSPVFLFLEEKERRRVRAALPKRAAERTEVEKEALRKYWRLRKELERQGRTTADCRVNEQYRAWLKRRGYDTEEFDPELYRRWVREGRP